MQQEDPLYSRITNSFLFIKAKEGVKRMTLFKINFLHTAYGKGTTSFSNKEKCVTKDIRILGFFSLSSGLKPNIQA